MILIHMESGLGNQMLTYLEYLAIKKTHPNVDIYLETTVYECEEALKLVNMWNGYEIENRFGLKLPNIKDLFDGEEWKQIIKEIKQTEWWNKDWSWPEHILPILNKHGLNIQNNFAYSLKISQSKWKKAIKNLFNGYPYAYLRKVLDPIIYKIRGGKDHSNELFYEGCDNFYCGQTLNFCKVNYGLEKIENHAIKNLQFKYIDEANKKEASKLSTTNSIAIHVRRTDMLGSSFVYYQNGYFKRALKKIKKAVGLDYNVVFFTDPGSEEWVKNNLKVFGLTNKDDIRYENLNRGTDSYKDLYLMSNCKYAIIGCSSFGWWGSFLNQRKDKITISPFFTMFNTTDHA